MIQADTLTALTAVCDRAGVKTGEALFLALSDMPAHAAEAAWDAANDLVREAVKTSVLADFNLPETLIEHCFDIATQGMIRRFDELNETAIHGGAA